MRYVRWLLGLLGIHRFPTFKEFCLGLSADAAKVAAGHYQVYDKALGEVTKIKKIPRTRVGQVATAVALSYAGSTIKVNSNEKTFLGNLKNEFGGDLTSELVLAAIRRTEKNKKENV